MRRSPAMLRLASSVRETTKPSQAARASSGNARNRSKRSAGVFAGPPGLVETAAQLRQRRARRRILGFEPGDRAARNRALDRRGRARAPVERVGVGEREDQHVERERGIGSDMEREDVSPLHGEFIDEPPRQRRTAGTRLAFLRDDLDPVSSPVSATGCSA